MSTFWIFNEIFFLNEIKKKNIFDIFNNIYEAYNRSKFCKYTVINVTTVNF